MTNVPSAAFTDTKPHYNILDGLRGVAALTVVWFHIFEAFATSHIDQRINHGYLAVDFFFILSGFVMGYAYDDRWKSMSVKDFIKRRLIRLHPMVVIGALIGVAMFYTQGCSVWDVSKISLGMLILATILNAFMIPVTTGSEIRGVGEMYPLNGPTWSLFFEYIGNILYVFIIRKLSTKVLSGLVGAAGIGLAIFAIWGPYGDICVGYSMTGDNMLGGLLRLLFAFSAGLLMSRVFKPMRGEGNGLSAKIKRGVVSYAFWLGAAAIVILSAIPRIGGAEKLWMNGLYDTFCFAVAFPLLVYIGASGETKSRFTTRLNKFLGDISYPLYMVHYPFIYLYYAWVKNETLTFEQSLPGALALFFGSIALAYVCLKLYDEPVRKWLGKNFLKR